MFGTRHCEPDTQAELAFGNLVAAVLAYLVLAAGAVVGRNLCKAKLVIYLFWLDVREKKTEQRKKTKRISIS